MQDYYSVLYVILYAILNTAILYMTLLIHGPDASRGAMHAASILKATKRCDAAHMHYVACTMQQPLNGAEGYNTMHR